MRLRNHKSRWVTVTCGKAFEPKEATEAEVATFLAAQQGATVIDLDNLTSANYVVGRNRETGQMLFSGASSLNESRWEHVFTGTYEECRDQVRLIKAGR